MDDLLVYDIKNAIKNPALYLRELPTVRRKINHYGHFNETFIRQAYRWMLDNMWPNTTVIDVGAYIGDTAVYFATDRNVSGVYSYEPIPTTFEEAKRTISRTPVSVRKKIRIFNNAVSGRETMIRVDPKFMGYGGTSFDERLSTKDGIAIRSMKLDDILKGKHNVAVKLDCEGEEVEIVKNSSLRGVYMIMMEYHYRDRRMLQMLREKGFTATMDGVYICAKRSGSG